MSKQFTMQHIDTSTYRKLNNKLFSFSYQEIITYCASVVNVCGDDQYWIQRLDTELQKINAQNQLCKPSTYITRNCKGIDIYNRWKNALHDTSSTDIAVWKLDTGYITQISIDIINSIIKEGNITLLQKLNSKGILPNANAIDLAIENGHLHIIVWLKEHGFIITQDNITLALQYDRKNIIDWLKQFYPIFFQSNPIIEEPSIDRIPEILELQAQGFIYANKFSIVCNGNLDVLNLLHQKGVIFDTSHANIAIKRKNIEVLKWFASKGIFPTQDAMRNVIKDIIKSNNVNMIHWLLQNGFTVSTSNANFATEHAHIETLQLFEMYGILPSDSVITNLVRSNKLNILCYLEQKGIIATMCNVKSSDIDAVIQHGIQYCNQEMIQWLEEHGFISQGKNIHTHIKYKPHITKRPSILASTRDVVWRTYHGDSSVGICYCCGKSLQFKGYHCSHVIPYSKSGEETLDNLRTSCASCNLSMRTQNLYMFILSRNLQGPGCKNVISYFAQHLDQRGV